MDIKDAQARSENMAAIKNKDTKPELYFRKLLFAHGFRYRKNVTYIFGHPDIYLAKYNTAIFVHGCFWHRHEGCRYSYQPKTRVEFWQKKFQNNVNRDLVVKNQLYASGVKCLVVWECTIKQMKKDEAVKKDVLKKTVEFIKSSDLYQEV